MTDSVLQFYEGLAENYHFIFTDWRASVMRQAGILDSFLGRFVQTPCNVLDCTAGIGTQAIGLATRGYSVHATDLSPSAIEKAKSYATEFDAKLTFGVANLLSLAESVEGTYDVVLAYDNAVSHFLNDEDLHLAVQQMSEKVRSGGLLTMSIRDYDKTRQEKPRTTFPSISETPDGRRITFQTWDWSEDGRTYAMSHFVTLQHGDEWEIQCNKTVLRPLQRDELSAVLEAVGLTDIQWHMPDSSGYYQPIVTGVKSD